MVAKRVAVGAMWVLLTAAPALAGPVTAPPAPPVDPRLPDLNRRTSALKDEIRAAHARLSLLLEDITGDVEGASEIVLRLDDDLGGWFRMIHARVVLDNEVQLVVEPDERAAGSRRPVFRGLVTPGAHTVQVLVTARGNGHGVFSYLNAYRFDLTASRSFTTTAGQSSRVRIVAYDTGGADRPVEERPAVRFVEKVSPLVRR
jgi:hypothetical protein